ncbi:MAG: hypothetical protein A07HB70_00497 [uncultured archaeon A07HB70]|nr:MAG: hypothetical protein A07HB70_00497 [uncultured archaeon A07HB70]
MTRSGTLASVLDTWPSPRSVAVDRGRTRPREPDSERRADLRGRPKPGRVGPETGVSSRLDYRSRRRRSGMARRSPPVASVSPGSAETSSTTDTGLGSPACRGAGPSQPRRIHLPHPVPSDRGVSPDTAPLPTAPAASTVFVRGYDALSVRRRSYVRDDSKRRRRYDRVHRTNGSRHHLRHVASVSRRRDGDRRGTARP